MRLEPLYRLTFRYHEAFRSGGEGLLLARGRCEGRLAGRLAGANRYRRRHDGTYLPELEAAVETESGATVLLRLRGYGRPEDEPVGRVLVAITHSTADEDLVWLNDALGVGGGEVREGREIVIDVEQAVWEPLLGTMTE